MAGLVVASTSSPTSSPSSCSPSSEPESYDFSLSEMTLDKAVSVIKEQFAEIKVLRDTLATNNAKMKQHWDRIKLWLDDVRSSNKHNQDCFKDTKQVIQQLKNQLNTGQSSQVFEENKEIINDIEAKLKTNEDHKKELEIANASLSDEMESLKWNQNHLLEKLKKTSIINENLQTENDKLIEENVNSYQKCQTLLVQTKQESRSVDKTNLSSKLESIELKTGDRFSNLINDNSEFTNFCENAVYKSIMNQLSTERTLVNDLRMQNNELEKTIKKMQDTMDFKLEQEREKYSENIQSLQRKHNEEITRLRLNNPDPNIMMTMAVDQEALKHQVMMLLKETKETKEEMASLKEIQAIKVEQCQRLDDANLRLTKEMKRQQEQDKQLINTLQDCIQDFNKKLIAEREHVNIKQDQNKRLREAFQQLLEDYKGLLDVNGQMQPMVEKNKNLQEQVDYLTAKTYATEESYQVQEEKYNKLRMDNEDYRAENEVLKAQADVYKSDFAAERESGIKQKHESGILKQSIQQLETVNRRLANENQDLLSRIEVHTEQQLSEMRQRCATNYNSMQASARWKHNSEVSGMEAMQHEFVEHYQCPQCNNVFPDADSLNLHFEEHK